MGILNGVDVDNSIEGEQDRLGGANIMDSDVYNMVVDMAYLDVSKAGAKCVHFTFKGEGNIGFRQTIYFTNRAGQPFYERDGAKHYLPGFNQINAIALLTAGKPLTELATEEKMVMVYDYDAGEEVPVQKEVLMEVLGGKLKLGVHKTMENKNKLVGNKYVPTNEMRTFNEVDKVFRQSDGQTITEIKAKADSADFLPKWEDKWKGVDKNKFIPVEGAPAGGGQTASQPTPDKLFAE